MGYLLYNFFLFPFYHLSNLLFFLRKNGGKERRGFLPSFSGKPLFWFHGASVGEVMVLSPLLQKVRIDFPGATLLLSTMTLTGKRRAEKLFRSIPQIVIYLVPFDFFFSVRRAFLETEPAALIIAETEFWPNLLREAKRRGTRIALVNGRVSNRSYKAYRLFRFFFKKVLSHFDLFLVQGNEDCRRLLSLGVAPNRVQILGSLKADSVILKNHNSQFTNHNSQFRKRLGIPEGKLPIVCGSTRPGEEEILLRMFKEVKRVLVDAYLILAPRHPSRFEEVKDLLRESGFRWWKRSSKSNPETSSGSDLQSPISNHDILLLDTLGELEWVYGAGEVAFVGGSLLPFGGHNLLEPAQWGIPVLFGPHIENSREMGEELIRSGGGIEIRDSKDLPRLIITLLSNPEERKRMGESAFQILQNNRGTSQKTFQLLLEKGILSTKHEARKPACRQAGTKHEGFSRFSLLLTPLSFFYYLGYCLWRLLYQWNFLRKSILKGFVISVGNITTGGTGKTPFVQYLASRLAQNGEKVAILTRGYGRKTKQCRMINAKCQMPNTNFELNHLTPEEVGDEPYLLSNNLNGVPIFVGPNRVEGGRLAKKKFGTETFILDDGFQYMKMKRNLDIVLIDATNPFGNGSLLPTGRLREPLASLNRAHLILLTRIEQVSDLSSLREKISNMNPSAPILESIHSPKEIHPVGMGQDAEGRPLPLHWLRGKRIIALSSIGNPHAFERTLLSLGANILERIRYRDHHSYSSNDLARIERTVRECDADAILTTEKDEVRLLSNELSLNPLNPLNPLKKCYVLRVEMKITKGEEILWNMVKRNGKWVK